MDWKFWLPTIIAAVGSLYQVLGYCQDKRLAGEGTPAVKRTYLIPSLIMILTWAAVGFNYYDHHYSKRHDDRFANLLKGWGGGNNECQAEVNTEKLLEFSGQYDVAIVCGIEDRRVDPFYDKRITVSRPFHIPPGAPSVIPVAAPLRNEMAEVFITGPKKNTYFPILVPKGTDTNEIRQLADVKRYGGKILNEKYFEE